MCVEAKYGRELNAGLDCIQAEQWYPCRGITDVRESVPKQRALEVPAVL